MKICPKCRYCYEDADSVCTLGEHGELLPSRHGSRLINEKYQLERLLGRGGMGAVYAGLHIELDRRVAIKLLLPDLVSDAQALERFRREARTAARIDHPNVVDTYDYGLLPSGEAYIVMELVEGQTLREYMDVVHELPIPEAVDIARQVADGIAAAHRNGIIHRDLKPSNIILAHDHQESLLAKVVDFGIAKLKEHTTSGALTNTGALIGTPRYMSPEQCSDTTVDERTDIYSLGIILYEMLAGRAPFDAPTATAIALKHVQEAPSPLRSFRPDIPEMVEKIVMQALEKDPAHRPQTATEFAGELSNSLDSFLPKISNVYPEAEPDELLATRDAASALVTPTSFNPLEITGPHHATLTEHSLNEDAIGTNRAGTPTNDLAQTIDMVSDRVDALVSTSQPNLDHETVTEVSAVAPKPIPSEQTATTPSVPPEIQHAEKDSNTRPLFSNASPRNKHYKSSLFVYGGIGLAVIIGLGMLWLSRLNSVPASQTAFNASPQSVTPTAIPSDVVQNSQSDPIDTSTHAPVQSAVPTLEEPADLVEPTRTERSALLAVLDGWIGATNAININRQINFYAPTLNLFYLTHNVSRSQVRAEKESAFAEARHVRMSISNVTIRLGEGGQTALMRFRKQFDIEGGAQNRHGEVLQELRWVKTKDGWKINSERDLQVVR